LEELKLAQRIRARANELWKQDGSLEGCADEYWRQARQLVELEVNSEAAILGNERVADWGELDTASRHGNCEKDGMLKPEFEAT
jgi:Protein of unknown function (DUF2934)